LGTKNFNLTIPNHLLLYTEIGFLMILNGLYATTPSKSNPILIFLRITGILPYLAFLYHHPPPTNIPIPITNNITVGDSFPELTRLVVGVGVGIMAMDGVGVLVKGTAGLGLAVGDSITVGDGLRVGEGLRVGIGLAVGVGVAFGCVFPVGLGAKVADGDAE
jgi:hypothetical protein